MIIKPEQYWAPQPGPQVEGYTCPADEQLIGGNRGGGKSSLLVGRQIRGALKYGHGWNGLIIRRKYKEFRELRRQFDEIINLKGLPAKRSGGETQIGYIRFNNGALVTLAAIQDLAMAEDFIGFAYTEIDIDEASNIPFIGPLMDTLTGCLRSAHGVPCQMVLTGNPGGPGAGQLKSMFVPVELGGDCLGAEEGKVNYVEIEQGDGSVVTKSRVYIRCQLHHNKVLMDADPNYERRMKGIQDENRRKSWVEGRWDVTIGQAFDFGEKNIANEQQTLWPVPSHAPLFMTFDWGFGDPFSVGWWWVDGENRIWRYAEWYGCKPNQANVGLRLTDREICEGILEREVELGINNREIIWILGHDCFKKKPDYKGGGQGPATSDEFHSHLEDPQVMKRYGNRAEKIRIIPNDPDKKTKIRQFRGRLTRSLDDEGKPTGMPMLMVYPNCKEFIRTIPNLCKDDLTGEYIEDHQEDHVFDDSCSVCQYYPIGVDDRQLREAAEQAAEDEVLRGMDTADRAANREYREIIKSLDAEDELPDWF
jgi:hypothetical protein